MECDRRYPHATGHWGDNYGTQIIGYFYPDDRRHLYLAADDNAVLQFGTNATARRASSRSGNGLEDPRQY
jgi:hypothetical protein